MRFSVNWPTIKHPPSEQTLLDLALLITLLPHLLILKWPMLVYLASALLIIGRQKRYTKLTFLFALGGAIALALSFFAEYNFASLSRLLVFISLLVSLLVYASILQRLSNTINFYLRMTPAMLLVLSFFFFNSVSMFFYALSALFILVALLLWGRMQASLAEAVRTAGLLFLFSLPIVALLFLVFPRISFKKSDFGFKSEQIRRTGHDGTMHLGSDALLVPSQKVVMEVTFKKEIPPDSALYFRGSALYIDNGNRWNMLPRNRQFQANHKPLIDKPANTVRYNITLYPHNKQWLYMLDIPTQRPPSSNTNEALIINSNNRITETYRYSGTSVLSYRLLLDNESIFPQEALVADPGRDPVTAKALKAMFNDTQSDDEKAERLLAYFRSLGLTYSLKPEPFDLEHPVDSFLHSSQIGYCVHFAASFATTARLVGIPSRIITGFKAERSSMVNNYLVIREAHAHAWVELYLQERGWVRFEPTSTARQISDTADSSQSIMQQVSQNQKNFAEKLWAQINIHYLYGKYMLESWIIYYDRLDQIRLLKKLINDTIFLAKFAGGFILFGSLSIVLFILLRREKCHDPMMCKMNKVIDLLERHGLSREAGETISNYLKRAYKRYPNLKSIQKINEAYHIARYSGHNNEITMKTLDKEVSTLLQRFKI